MLGGKTDGASVVCETKVVWAVPSVEVASSFMASARALALADGVDAALVSMAHSILLLIVLTLVLSAVSESGILSYDAAVVRFNCGTRSDATGSRLGRQARSSVWSAPTLRVSVWISSGFSLELHARSIMPDDDILHRM
eukprot:1889551-Rhodomonas_salina.2